MCDLAVVVVEMDSADQVQVMDETAWISLLDDTVYWENNPDVSVQTGIYLAMIRQTAKRKDDIIIRLIVT